MNVMYVIFGIIWLILAFGFYASYSISSNVYLKVFCKKKTNQKIVALTYDDGPSEYTPALLDLLNKYQVKATFFCVGNAIDGRESILKRIQKEGHSIGNHTNSHTGTLPFYLPKKMLRDIELCDEKITRVTNENVRYFRPPFGVTNIHYSLALKNKKYIIIGWSIRSYDTRGKDPQIIVDRIMRQMHEGAVVLLHDRMPNVCETTELLLQELIKKGYRLVSMDDFLE